MKATDLMIGDWVMRGNIASEPMKVTEIIPYKDYVCMDFTGLAVAAKFSQINPIPLTPEILEKNGWFYPGNYFPWMKMDNPYRELWGCSHSDGTFWLYASGDCDKDESFAEIRHVHELQHVLKLRGIDKEIVL